MSDATTREQFENESEIQRNAEIRYDAKWRLLMVQVELMSLHLEEINLRNRMRDRKNDAIAEEKLIRERKKAKIYADIGRKVKLISIGVPLIAAVGFGAYKALDKLM